MFWQEYQMLLPIQNLQVLAHLYGDLSTDSEVSDLDEELYESDNKQFHEEFDTETSAKWETQPNNITSFLTWPYHCHSP